MKMMNARVQGAEAEGAGAGAGDAKSKCENQICK